MTIKFNKTELFAEAKAKLSAVLSNPESTEADQTDEHGEDVPFACGQGTPIQATYHIGGQKSMMIRHTRIVHHQRRVHRHGHSGKGQAHDGQVDEFGQTLGHVGCQVAGIGARIGRQLFFIQRLGIVQRLLGGVTEQAVGVSLERGQVVQFGLRLGLFFLFHRQDGGVPGITGGANRLGLLRRFHLFRRRGKAGQIDAGDVERLRRKIAWWQLLRVPLLSRGRPSV